MISKMMKERRQVERESRESMLAAAAAAGGEEEDKKEEGKEGSSRSIEKGRKEGYSVVDKTDTTTYTVLCIPHVQTDIYATQASDRRTTCVRSRPRVGRAYSQTLKKKSGRDD